MNRTEDIKQWEAQVGPTLDALMTTLATTGRAARSGPAALLAASDQLDAMARDTCNWLSTRSCPLTDIDDRLVRAMRSLRMLVRLSQSEALCSASPNVRAIDQEIEGLMTMTTTVLAVLSDHHRS